MFPPRETFGFCSPPLGRNSAVWTDEHIGPERMIFAPGWIRRGPSLREDRAGSELPSERFSAAASDVLYRVPYEVPPSFNWNFVELPKRRVVACYKFLLFWIFMWIAATYPLVPKHSSACGTDQSDPVRAPGTLQIRDDENCVLSKTFFSLVETSGKLR
jgi:hypothetical protein